MRSSLPTDPAGARSLTGVVSNALRAIRGEEGWFRPAPSVIVLLVDGLGALNLRQRAGHARFLAEAMGKKDVARSVFPSTTAAALASLWTGVTPGEHGILGYRVRVPDTGIVANQLNGWERGELDTESWPLARSLTTTLRARERLVVCSRPEYATSGFTTAMFPHGIHRDAAGLDDRVEKAIEAAAVPGTLVYLYAPELDTAGHRAGWESDEWAAVLEQIDRAARRLHTASDAGIVVTADHGMVDVPAHRQIIVDDAALRDDVTDVAGEPRMLHLYARERSAARLVEAWRAAEGERAWVLSRDEAIDAGLFGARVAPEAAKRIGDVIVAARSGVAYYDGRTDDISSRRMVGQHGSLTEQERIVPLIGLAAWS
ncbi:MAG: alkaline phosphatase family protein [Microbacterium ginsengisoli]|uniref:alkaline phosphatase family protein n=1 Tax=Microbacterium TaxID=33882 RepID=UPI0006FBD59F|nr:MULTISPECIES: nucleotide pyrophosphatase/phosphodiesterase family protein [unclassified Microbacterium]MBN9197382.1 alkaline phosphatase family protein [Microbacterium ginsengisoli]KQR93224.1 nucleotide pyrophosphatase [Microbacterium sp. Leaf351]KQS05727.1 nucleotide pyrophosphatase [Microbacterium sp. Leaf347]ODU78401.1 MAG: nucleotide pyrophosphatase [Microbacterium sp. SCN 71-21]OJU77300.1 MAG: nucleotide pyrophosphatase [Microbacterium sp. 71-23]